MADSKLTALSAFTPVLTDIIYGVDDPAAAKTPGKVTLTALRTLLQANFTTLTATDLTLTGTLHTSDAGELTISSGAITVTGGFHTVDTESDAATDELVTINGGVDGASLVLQAENGARSINITRAGNIKTPTDPTVLGNVNAAIRLVYSGALSAWVTTCWMPNGTTSLTTSTKMYHFQSFSGSSGTNYVGGFYDLKSADLNLNQGSTTGTAGSANNAAGAHAILVAGGVGAATGGTTGTAVITVSGTSISDSGVRSTGAQEVIISDVTDAGQMAADVYHETAKKWIGLVTYTITTDGDRTSFNADFNVGLAKYDDMHNTDFIVANLEVVGLAGAADTGFNVTLCEHSASGWVYHASSFVSPTGNEIADMNTDYNTEVNLVSGLGFAWKRSNLSTLIAGSVAAPTTSVPNGFLIRIVTGANAAVQSMDVHVGMIPA